MPISGNPGEKWCELIDMKSGFVVCADNVPLGTVKLGRSWANYDRDFELDFV